MPLVPGTSLGRFEILAPLGAGGMGEVYRARDPRLERDVAVKVLPERLARDPAALARFQIESRALAALSHPNLLAIFDVGQQDGISYAVTELLEGETLRLRLRRGALEWREAAHIAAELADALSAAHERGIIHRDLKPENVFLMHSGRSKLLDFGLARVCSGSAADSRANGSDATTVAAGLTLAGAITGTPGYFSPEQARGDTVSAATDIFSFGCVLYEMLSGRRAFPAATLAAGVTAVLQHSPPPLAAPATLPPELERLTASCLEKAPSRRPRSARDLSLRLESLYEIGASAHPAPTPTPAPQTLTLDLAVLPWVNQSGDADADYLCEGVPESIMNALARVRTLRVAPRSLSFHTPAGAADPLSLGRALNVRAILSGRLQQRAGMLILSTELTDVASGAQVWGERLRYPLGDLFALETELADKVCAGLRTHMGAEAQQQRDRRQPATQEAYPLYLRARQQFLLRTPVALQQAAGLLQQAIDLDPGYALAYAGLAETHALTAILAVAPGRLAYARARAAAAAAVSLDPELAEGHAALSLPLGFGACEWTEAEKEIRRALELERSVWTSHYYCALLLAGTHRLEEGYEHARLAERYEPLGPLARYVQVACLYWLRRDEETIACCERALADGVDHPYIQGVLCLARMACGERGPALVAVLDRLSVVTNPTFTAVVASSYAHLGETERARALVQRLEYPAAGLPVDAAAVAFARLALGDRDVALAALDTVVPYTAGSLSFSSADRAWDSIRHTPQWQACMRRLHLAP